MSEKDKIFLNDILNLIYNINNIPNKIKFKVLDLQEMFDLHYGSGVPTLQTSAPD
jgi:hypothetical protein